MAFDRKVPTDHDLALDAVKQRPDIPKELIESAWALGKDLGPAAVLALCKTQPTPEQFEQEARRQQDSLRQREVRRVAALAREAQACLDGNVERLDDATRRDVLILIGDRREDVAYLAWWSAIDTRRETARRAEWRKVVLLAEQQAMVELLTKTHSAIQSAIAESHVPKRKRRSGGGYTARSKG